MLEYRKHDLERVQQVAADVLREFIRICDKYGLDYFVHWGTALGAVRHQGFIPWDDDVDVGMLREDYDRFLKVAPGEIGDRYVLSSAFLQENCFGLYTMMSAAGTLHVTQQESLWGYQHGIRMDIFPFDAVPEDRKKRRKQILGVRFWNMLYTVKNLSKPHLPGDTMGMRIVRGLCRAGHIFLKPIPARVFLSRARRWALKYRGRKGLYTLLYDQQAEKWKLTWEDIYPLQEGTFEGMQVKLLHHNHEALRAAYGDYMQLPPKEQRVNHYSGRLKFNEDNHEKSVSSAEAEQ